MIYLLNNKLMLSIVILSLLLLPILVSAQAPAYAPMVDLPGFSDGQSSDSFEDFINQLYIVAITLGAMLAVIKIVIAGVKWMMSDIATTKSSAKGDIKGALIGLLIIISAALILETINPALNDIDLTFSNQSVDNSVETSAPTNSEGDCLGNNCP
jgi:hypothetical protein